MSKSTTQVKFTIESEIVSTFRARCACEGTSMTCVIAQWMKAGHPIKPIKVRTETRPHRREAVLEIIRLLNTIQESEAEYRDSIPEQFEHRQEAAEHACDQLAEALSSLEEAY